jgi:thiol-disulfide isomerase/thioredoxin
MLTQERTASQSAIVSVRTAPEFRGDYRVTAWPATPLAMGRWFVPPPALFRPSRVASFLLALIAILANFAEDDVSAADAALKPWIELKPSHEGPLLPFPHDSLSGESVDLAQAPSPAVLVHFFATWCEPCRAELTALQQVHARLRDRYVTIVGVDVGEVDSRVRRFFAERPASFPILLDRDSAASKAWQVSILPTTFLLDSNLVPRFVAEGDVDWARPEIEESVTSLIRQKPAGKTSAF